MRSWRSAILTSRIAPGYHKYSAGCRANRPGAYLVKVVVMRSYLVFSGTVIRHLLCSPGQLVATTTPAGLLALLAFLPPGAAFGQPSALAGSTVPGTPATAVTSAEKPAPPLVAPGAAALLGGPEPLQISGPQGEAPPALALPLAVPLPGPVVPATALTLPALTLPALTPPVQAPPAPSKQAPGVPPQTPASVEAPPPTTLVLDRSRRLLTVFENGRPLRRFPVAVGMPGWETPVGSFRVLEKTINPVWEHPQKGTHTPTGPANPLGSRWIGFHQDCQGRRGWDGEQMLDIKGCVVTGFHGTPHSWTVGRALSHGCVRLHDEDVREVFDLVSLGTPVTVLP
jgi:L,D-transpeptidase ErfK/SrfK